MQAIERVKSHFNSKEKQIIEVAEWGENDKPMYIYASPLTLYEKNKLYKLVKEDDLASMAEVIIMKACDESGNKLFSRADKPDFMRECDPDILIRIANMIISGDDFREAKKNF